MKNRFLIALLVLLALLSVSACNKQPASSDNTQQQQQQQAGSGQQSASQTSQPASTGGGTAQTAPASSEAAKPPAAEKQAEKAPPPVVIPAGTVLKVRLDSAVGSKTSQAGQPFSGTLMAPVSAGGQTVIPSGSPVDGEVVEAKPAGRFKGAASLSLRLTGVSAKGQHLHIDTAPVTQTSTGKGKRTAAMIGGGGAGGALIGGLAGGGKGAAIGALVGAGAGTAGSALTGNRDITLPAETALSFRLAAPLTIKR